MNTAVQRDAPSARCFQFEGVVVDERASRLFVDGRERLCSQRAFRLLCVMCEAPGQVLAKQRVIDKLWPGGQIVSDEALTQAVFRARACLDGHANRLVTVRGVGLRLDAQVRCADAWLPTPAQAAEREPPSEPIAPQASVALEAPPLAPAPTPVAVRPTARVGFWALALLLVALLGGAWLARAWLASDAAEVLDVGYGLRASDAHAESTDSLPLLREAFAHEAAGDRARARALLETVHSSDRATPVPAIFMALWAIGAGDADSADRWLSQARSRVEPLRAPQLTALLAYAEAERRGSVQDVLRYAGAVLDLQPDAWQMRLARAHLLQAGGMRDAALTELKAIRVETLAHRKLGMVLADRGSLGDPDGAEAELARLASSAPEATLNYTRGRLAWTRGDLAAAADAYAAAEVAARREARFDVLYRSIVNQGVIAMQTGQLERAIAQLERAREGMAQGRWTNDEADIGLMLAQLHALRGDAAGTAAELNAAERAAVRSSYPIYRDLCRAVRARLLPGTPLLPGEGGEPALASLLDAYAALEAGQRDQAQAAYAIAARRADAHSMLRDEVRWLAAQLGEPVEAAPPIDPPYPPLSRLATRLMNSASAIHASTP